MDHNSDLFYIIMGVLAVLGVLGSAFYYFFRFAFRTDHDRDIEAESPGALEESREDVVTDLTREIHQDESISITEKMGLEPGEDGSGELTVPIHEEVTQETSKRSIDQALEKTRSSFFSKLKDVFSSSDSLGGEDLESLEEVLYTSDLGPQTVQRLMESVEEKLSSADRKNLESVTATLKSEMRQIFSELEIEPSMLESVDSALRLGEQTEGTQVWLVVGVNGVGKTTTIGKLANAVAKSGKKVMVAAGDTFRAAAGDQLKVWSQRAQVEIFSPPNVTDPSAVAFDACSSAKSKNYDVLIVDTAGRLHTQSNLMGELEKMKRVIQKVFPEGPHEALLVLDANSGQNALVQARQFNEAIEISGVVLTKLDGSAKGGVAVGLAHELKLPIRLIGLGEGIDDIAPFNPQSFVNSIL